MRNYRDYEVQEKTVTVPVFFLIVFFCGTYLPMIYQYLPILGKLRIVLVSGIVLLLSFIFYGGQSLNAGSFKDPIFKMWLLFMFMIGFSILFSVDRGRSFNYLIINLKFFIPFIVMIKILDNSKKLDLSISVFSWCGVLMALATIVNYFIYSNTYAGGYRASAIESGIFADPNDLALLFNACLPLQFYTFIVGRRKALSFVGIIIIITAIMLTFSRGGFIGMCVAAVSAGIMYKRNNKKIMIYIIAGAITFWVLSPETYKERISTITDIETDENTGKTGTRLDAWKSVFSVAIENPFIGNGAGCSLYIAGQELSDWHLIHNSFLQIFTELGLFGFFVYLMLYFVPYLSISKNCNIRLDRR